MASRPSKELLPKPPPKFFDAPALAAFCNVTLKTIHNWAKSGKLPHFRTPNRRLQFTPEGVRDFLVHYGYPVPKTVLQAVAAYPIPTPDAAGTLPEIGQGE